MGSNSLSMIKVRLQNLFDNDEVALLKITCYADKLIQLTNALAKAVIHTIKLNGIVFVHVITSSDICPNNNIVVKSNFTTMPVLQNGGYIWEMMELTHCSQPNGLIDDNCEIKFSKKLSDSTMTNYMNQLSELLGFDLNP
uniref:Non-structural protein 1 n=3 Tax=Human respiratory syncytial virus TaxID=11250 RepID=A0A2H4HTU2_HRSV|nr:nonstructural protein 1 [Human orthopneumovirus]AWO13010.1 non-structural protein 1 [Human respiratory syncytial virus A]ARR29191.1 nonstructural protein 1 [Human orthopneumovirus]AWO13141.1 non-structural protein 1 [Human respiratory syncytial virus A]AWO13196.1 non-structural protein 1 [Human respiratory syncytial virus A]